MNVFDPMQSMNALAGGMELGSHIRSKQTQNALAPMVAKGDYKSAMDYAGSRGDLGQVQDMKTQYEAQLANMSEQDKQAAAKRAEGIARVAAGLQSAPYEQRKALLQQNLPMLQEMGMDPAMIQGFDPTDEGIGQVLAQVTPLTELLKKPTYFAPTEIAGPDGKPTLAQFSNAGGAPQQFEGMAPYQEPQGPLSPIGDLVADLNAGRITPEQYQIEIARMNKPGTTVNVNGGKTEEAFAKGLGENAAKNLDLIFTEGKDANNKIAKAQTMEALLDEIDYTGWGGNTLLASQRILQALGITVADDIGAKEAASALTKEMGLALKSDLPGPMSNADREFLMSIPPGINVTDAGNDALLYMYKARNKYSAELSDYMYSVNPRTEQQYNDAIRSFNMEYGPIFSEEDRIQLMKAVSGTSQ